MTYNRRDFIKSGSLISAGLLVQPLSSQLLGCKGGSSGKIRDNFGLQLYTLREDMPKDPKGILRQVASFGYTQIESYEHDKLGIFWGMSPQEFKTYLDSLGMKAVSSHCDINRDFERKVDQAAVAGMKYLICPWLGPQKSLDDFRRAAGEFNKRGELCKKAGLRFAYHNHDYSFLPLEGQLPQDVMMQSTDPDLVDFEMDIYWVVTAGQDPVSWFNRYPNRFTLSHIKDRKKEAPVSEKDASTVLGKGSIDFQKLLSEASNKGMQYYIVEQERYDGTTPVEAVKANADYMKSFKI